MNLSGTVKLNGIMLLEVQNLKVVFDTDRGQIRAVNDVSFSVAANEIVGIVGESGCGKSVTAAATMGLIPNPPGRVTGGRILFEGEDVSRLSPGALRALRGQKIGMIFQDPLSSLNPVLNIETQMIEGALAHGILSRDRARSRAADLLDQVGLPDPQKQLRSYPHELSGGMRQRVMIAMALMLEPKLLIADEPTTALDVTVQAQLIELFQRLSRDHNMAMLLISHDLGIVVQLARRILVMYAGHLVEEAPTEALFASPRHPYTQGLLDSIPDLETGKLPVGIGGQVPDPAALPAGCSFHPRCPNAKDRCRETFPEISTDPGGRAYACYYPLKDQV